MQKRRVRRPDLSKVSPKSAIVAAGCAVVIILLVTLCITMVMRSHIQSEYASARSEIGEELYTQLYMLCKTFDQVTLPGQDLQNAVIPKMKEYYLAAQALNNALYNAFGARYSVLPQETLSAMDQAFEAYDAAFKGGKSTEEAQGAMQSCMDVIQNLLGTRYRDGILKAA